MVNRFDTMAQHSSSPMAATCTNRVAEESNIVTEAVTMRGIEMRMRNGRVSSVVAVDMEPGCLGLRGNDCTERLWRKGIVIADPAHHSWQQKMRNHLQKKKE